jgi:hypothetical protein
MIRLTTKNGKPIAFKPDDISVVYVNEKDQTCVARSNEESGWVVAESWETVMHEIDKVELRGKVHGF